MLELGSAPSPGRAAAKKRKADPCTAHMTEAARIKKRVRDSDPFPRWSQLGRGGVIPPRPPRAREQHPFPSRSPCRPFKGAVGGRG
eukprot:5429020-Prymnesium_polylepis.5